MWDTSDWECICVVLRDVDTVAAEAGVHIESFSGAAVVFELVGPNTSLLKYSARHGFPHMSLEMLERFWREHEIPCDGRPYM